MEYNHEWVPDLVHFQIPSSGTDVELSAPWFDVPTNSTGMDPTLLESSKGSDPAVLPSLKVVNSVTSFLVQHLQQNSSVMSGEKQFPLSKSKKSTKAAGKTKLNLSPYGLEQAESGSVLSEQFKDAKVSASFRATEDSSVVCADSLNLQGSERVIGVADDQHCDASKTTAPDFSIMQQGHVTVGLALDDASKKEKDMVIVSSAGISKSTGVQIQGCSTGKLTGHFQQEHTPYLSAKKQTTGKVKKKKKKTTPLGSDMGITSIKERLRSSGTVTFYSDSTHSDHPNTPASISVKLHSRI